MNDQQITNTPSVSSEISEEKIVECMRKSKSIADWNIRKNHFRFRLGDNFNNVWTKVILLSGVAEEVLKKIEHTSVQQEVNPWEEIKISENPDRIAPL